MTKSKKQTEQNDMPAVMEYKRDKRFICYMTKIGYNKVKDEGGKVRFVRAWQYHGQDYMKAQKRAIELTEKWEEIVAAYKRDLEHYKLWKRVEELGKDADEDGDELAAVEEPEHPHWPTEEDAEREERRRATSRMTFGPPTGEPPLADVTLEQAEKKYLAAYQARIGLHGSRGIKQGTYDQAKKCLELVLRGNGRGEGKPIDLKKDIARITRSNIEGLVNYWWSKQRELSERTAANYLRFFKQFIDWLDAQEIGFRKPKTDGLFSFANPKGHIEKFDAELVKNLLKSGTERCRLFQLLALNCGFYQIDIANLAYDEIIELNGETYICRRRDKSSHQNDFTTLWWLFPEVAALIKKHLAPPNKAGPDGKRLAFVNVHARSLKNGKTDNIRDSFEEARRNAGITTITFKQYRKFGVSAIKRITMNPEIARMYAAQKIQGVLGCYDRDDFFDPLTEALEKWRLELKAQGVLDVKSEVKCYSDGKPKADAPSGPSGEPAAAAEPA